MVRERLGNDESRQFLTAAPAERQCSEDYDTQESPDQADPADSLRQTMHQEHAGDGVELSRQPHVWRNGRSDRTKLFETSVGGFCYGICARAPVGP